MKVGGDSGGWRGLDLFWRRLVEKKVCFLGGGGGAQWAKFSILVRNVK